MLNAQGAQEARGGQLPVGDHFLKGRAKKGTVILIARMNGQHWLTETWVRTASVRVSNSSVDNASEKRKWSIAASTRHHLT